jgi:hypothetical protein
MYLGALHNRGVLAAATSNGMVIVAGHNFAPTDPQGNDVPCSGIDGSPSNQRHLAKQVCGLPNGALRPVL